VIAKLDVLHHVSPMRISLMENIISYRCDGSRSSEGVVGSVVAMISCVEDMDATIIDIFHNSDQR
jgi:hypothetical protein